MGQTKVPSGAWSWDSSGPVLRPYWADVLLVGVEDRDAATGSQSGGIGATAHDVQVVVGTTGDGNGVEEAVATTQVLPTDGVAVLEGYRCNFGDHLFLTGESYDLGCRQSVL